MMVHLRYLHVFAITVIIMAKLDASLTASHSRQRQFQISYLLDVIPHKSIKAVILSSKKAGSQMSCGQMCVGKQECVTAIYNLLEKKCILLKSKLSFTNRHRTTTDQDQAMKMIVLQTIDPCSPNPCLSQRRCTEKESGVGVECSCAVDERGSLCEIKLSGTSCKDIKNKFAKYNPKNGKYRLASLDGKESFTAYCDMEFDQGGWTQVTKVESQVASKNLLKYRDVSALEDFNVAENYVMTSEFLKKFRNISDFKQFRYECRSNLTKTKFHIKTKENYTAIVDYLVGATDTRPDACGTFTIYPDDSSVLSKNCAQWGNSKWGEQNIKRNIRMVDHPMFIPAQKHFILEQDHDRFECDNFASGVTTGDFWKIYVK